MAQPIEQAWEATWSSLTASVDEAISQCTRFCRFVQEELKPFPGRSFSASRIMITAVATVMVSMTLRIPLPDISAYIIFFIANADGVRSVKLGLAAMAAVTVALVLAMTISICFMDSPWFRLPVTFVLLGGAVWLSQVLVMAALGRLLSVVLVLYLSLADGIPNAEILTETVLWLWSVVGIGVGMTVLVNLLLPHRITTPAPGPEPTKKGPLVEDAFSNPKYYHFALKTLLAIIVCEVFMNGVAWRGIRTSMVTCVVTALATNEGRHQKQVLRLLGMCIGGLIGLGAVIFIVPNLDSIFGLSLLVAAGTFVFAWVAVGSPRFSYAGFQMALAFYILLLPNFNTNIDLTAIRDRFVGILIGIVVMWIFFDHLWSSPEDKVSSTIFSNPI